MAGYKVYYVKTSDRAETIDISPGQVIFCEDTRGVFFDNDMNQRINYSLVVDLKTEAARTALAHPYNAIYFVEETGALWKYTNKWISLTAGSSQQIVFDDFEDFPAVGVSNRLYMDGVNMYRWYGGEYKLINGKHDEWLPMS